MMEATVSAKSISSAKHYPALDGLRGIAILMVFLTHYGDLGNSSSVILRTITNIKHAGWIGVDLFFVLSGFLITGILFDTRGTPGYFRNFYIRRALRLFPVSYGTALVLLLLTPFMHLHWVAAQLWYLFYGGNFVWLINTDYTKVGPFTLLHFWSLAVEEQFYFVWPALVLWIGDRTRLIRVALFMIAGALLLRIALVSLGVPSLYNYVLLPTRVDGFAVGCFLALLLRGRDLMRLLNPSRVVVVVSFASVVAICVLGHSTEHTNPWMNTIGYSILAIGFGALLVLALEPSGLVHRVCRWSVLRFYGQISYGFYVYHLLLHDLLKPIYISYVKHLHRTELAGALYFITVVALLTALSYLSFRFFETPFLKLKSKFSYKRSSETAPKPVLI